MIDAFPQLLAGSTANVVIANELFDGLAPYFPLCHDHASSHDLTLAVFGGRFNGTTLAAQALVLPASATSYVEAIASTGVISSNTSGYTSGRIPLGVAVTTATGIFSYTQEGRAAGADGSGSGSVTSVALSLPGIFSVAGSPVTSSGTFAVTLAAQAANVVWAGPGSGSAAAPTFRSLVLADLPFAGASSGVATLDGTGKVPTAQLPASVVGSMNYAGTWNASTNTPALASGTGTKGTLYKVAVAGTTTIDGINAWNVGDDIVFDGTTWDRILGASSVAGSPLTTKGDLYGYSSTTSRIAVGTDGQVLTADSTQATGVKWASPTSGGGIAINSQSAAYTLVLGDANGCIYHPAADTTARTWTIPANAIVAFPVGTAITFDNDIGAGVLTIAITTDTMVLVGTTGSTGSRTLAAGGQATALKVTSTRWRINGNGLT